MKDKVTSVVTRLLEEETGRGESIYDYVTNRSTEIKPTVYKIPEIEGIEHMVIGKPMEKTNLDSETVIYTEIPKTPLMKQDDLDKLSELKREIEFVVREDKETGTTYKYLTEYQTLITGGTRSVIYGYEVLHFPIKKVLQVVTKTNELLEVEIDVDKGLCYSPRTTVYTQSPKIDEKLMEGEKELEDYIRATFNLRGLIELVWERDDNKSYRDIQEEQVKRLLEDSEKVLEIQNEVSQQRAEYIKYRNNVYNYLDTVMEGTDSVKTLDDLLHHEMNYNIVRELMSPTEQMGNGKSLWMYTDAIKKETAQFLEDTGVYEIALTTGETKDELYNRLTALTKDGYKKTVNGITVEIYLSPKEDYREVLRGSIGEQDKELIGLVVRGENKKTGNKYEEELVVYVNEDDQVTTLEINSLEREIEVHGEVIYKVDARKVTLETGEDIEILYYPNKQDLLMNRLPKELRYKLRGGKLREEQVKLGKSNFNDIGEIGKTVREVIKATLSIVND